MFDPDSDSDSIKEFIVGDNDKKALRTFKQPRTILEEADEEHDKDSDEESSVEDSYGSHGEGAESSEPDEDYVPVVRRDDTRKSDRIRSQPVMSYAGMTRKDKKDSKDFIFKGERSEEELKRLKIMKEELGSLDFAKLVMAVAEEESEVGSHREESFTSKPDDTTRSATGDEPTRPVSRDDATRSGVDESTRTATVAAEEEHKTSTHSPTTLSRAAEEGKYVTSSVEERNNRIRDIIEQSKRLNVDEIIQGNMNNRDILVEKCNMFNAKFDSICISCRKPIRAGDIVYGYKIDKFQNKSSWRIICTECYRKLTSSNRVGTASVSSLGNTSAKKKHFKTEVDKQAEMEDIVIEKLELNVSILTDYKALNEISKSILINIKGVTIGKKKDANTAEELGVSIDRAVTKMYNHTHELGIDIVKDTVESNLDIKYILRQLTVSKSEYLGKESKYKNIISNTTLEKPDSTMHGIEKNRMTRISLAELENNIVRKRLECISPDELYILEESYNMSKIDLKNRIDELCDERLYQEMEAYQINKELVDRTKLKVQKCIINRDKYTIFVLYMQTIISIYQAMCEKIADFASIISSVYETLNSTVTIAKIEYVTPIKMSHLPAVIKNLYLHYINTNAGSFWREAVSAMTYREESLSNVLQHIDDTFSRWDMGNHDMFAKFYTKDNYKAMITLNALPSSKMKERLTEIINKYFDDVSMHLSLNNTEAQFVLTYGTLMSKIRAFDITFKSEQKLTGNSTEIPINIDDIVQKMSKTKIKKMLAQAAIDSNLIAKANLAASDVSNPREAQYNVIGRTNLKVSDKVVSENLIAGEVSRDRKLYVKFGDKGIYTYEARNNLNDCLPRRDGVPPWQPCKKCGMYGHYNASCLSK